MIPSDGKWGRDAAAVIQSCFVSVHNVNITFEFSFAGDAFFAVECYEKCVFLARRANATAQLTMGDIFCWSLRKYKPKRIERSTKITSLLIGESVIVKFNFILRADECFCACVRVLVRDPFAQHEIGYAARAITIDSIFLEMAQQLNVSHCLECVGMRETVTQ